MLLLLDPTRGTSAVQGRSPEPSGPVQVIVLRGLRACLAEALAQVTEAAGKLYLQGDPGDHGALFSTAREAICSCADSITQAGGRLPAEPELMAVHRTSITLARHNMLSRA